MTITILLILTILAPSFPATCARSVASAAVNQHLGLEQTGHQ
jgi:hypothetical protein